MLNNILGSSFSEVPFFAGGFFYDDCTLGGKSEAGGIDFLCE